MAASIEKEAGHPVPEPCYVEDITSGIITGKSSFGSTNWGLPAAKGVINKEDNRDHLKHEEHDATRKPSPFQVPMYIKAGDYASIRNCHLNGKFATILIAKMRDLKFLIEKLFPIEGIAAKIASCQLSGDMRNIQGFLWQKVPEFNKGLYMKLLGNLNHFMYFMPPDMVQFEGKEMHSSLHLNLSKLLRIEHHVFISAFIRHVLYPPPSDERWSGSSSSKDCRGMYESIKNELHYV